MFQTSFYEDDRDKYHCPIPGDRVVEELSRPPKEDGCASSRPISGGIDPHSQSLCYYAEVTVDE